jgi:hypothetical protein
VLGIPLGTADATTLQLVYGSDNRQSFPDFDWLKIDARKSLEPIAGQCVYAAAKFLDQPRRIAPRPAYNFQSKTLSPGSAYDYKLAVSVRLEKTFVHFDPIQFGHSAPQIHRANVMYHAAGLPAVASVVRAVRLR